MQFLQFSLVSRSVNVDRQEILPTLWPKCRIGCHGSHVANMAAETFFILALKRVVGSPSRLVHRVELDEAVFFTFWCARF